jgi:hypothetical protein
VHSAITSLLRKIQENYGKEDDQCVTPSKRSGFRLSGPREHRGKSGTLLTERQRGTVRERRRKRLGLFQSRPGVARGHIAGARMDWPRISDEKQKLCFVLALWNGKDPISTTSTRQHSHSLLHEISVREPIPTMISSNQQKAHAE